MPTKYPAFLILHNPPPIREQYKAFAIDGTRDRTLIATSQYSATLWAIYLDRGLPETDCGGVVLVKPGNAEALAWGIREAWTAGRSHRPRGRTPG